VAWEITMKNISSNLFNAAEVARKRQPDIAVLIVAFFAGAAMICTALIAPVLLTALTDMTQPPEVAYQQCGRAKQDPNRLACYDRVQRRISLRSAKDPTASGEILTEQLVQSRPQ
jgi:hypothetical protein